jgi:two-component system, sensor histidine kinase and response regulator
LGIAKQELFMSVPKAKPGTVLIVDDVVDNLHMLTDMLELQGHEVRIAMSGKEALEKIADKHPDLILLDIQMPGMTGYEVCEKVKGSKATEDIPVIFLSALSETADILKGFEVGGVDYVSKPFQFREVVARVQSQMAVAQQRRELAELRERDQQQFQMIAAAKDIFIHAAAHDLKNPLTGVFLYIQSLRESPPKNQAALEDALDGIEGRARKMQSLVSDILDLAQMQVGNPMTFIEQPIQPIMLKVMENFDMLAREKNISLFLKMPDDPIRMALDNHYFERMIDNLVSNAIKYTDPNGEVRVSLELNDGILIRVTDTGIGIPKEDLSKVFDAFYRVKKKNHSKESGTGLGLSIVAAVVQEHGGTINVESAEGHGTSFSLYFRGNHG